MRSVFRVARGHLESRLRPRLPKPGIVLQLSSKLKERCPDLRVIKVVRQTVHLGGGTEVGEGAEEECFFGVHVSLQFYAP